MVSIRKTRWLAAAVGVAFAAAAPDAAADGQPHVRILPPLPAPPAPPGAPAAEPPRAMLDGTLPASVSFVMDLRLADIHVNQGSDAAAVLHVWPRHEHPCGTAPPPAGTPQYHRRAMSLTGTGADRMLSATLPPLQVGQPFCFYADVRAALSDTQVSQVAHAAARRLAAKLATSPDCQAAASDAEFTSALDAAIHDVLPGAVDTRRAATLARSNFVTDGMDKCGAAQAASSVAQQVSRNLPPLVSLQQAARSALVNDVHPPVNLTEPLVLGAGDAPVLARQLLNETSSSATVRQAADQLEARGIAAWPDVLRHFADALDGAADAKAKTAAVKAAEGEAENARKATSIGLAIWTGSGFEPFAKYQQNPDAVASASVLAQLAQLEKPGVVPANQQAALKAIRDAVDRFQKATDKLNAARERLRASEAASTAAASALASALFTALSKDDVRQSLLVAVSGMQVDQSAGGGTTPDRVNYISPDLGLILGLPSGGASREVWFLPYFGINVYSTAVDRTVPMDQLTGAHGEWFRQHLSLTVGMTIAEPTLTGRTLEKPLGASFYPLVALGWRATHFVRIVGGTVFYRLADKNPASGSSTFYAAPFLGASLDVDLVHALTQGLK